MTAPQAGMRKAAVPARSWVLQWFAESRPVAKPTLLRRCAGVTSIPGQRHAGQHGHCGLCAAARRLALRWLLSMAAGAAAVGEVDCGGPAERVECGREDGARIAAGAAWLARRRACRGRADSQSRPRTAIVSLQWALRLCRNDPVDQAAARNVGRQGRD